LNEKTFWLVSCALIIAMLTCGAFTIINLFNVLIPDWRPTYMAGLVAFAAFERLFTYRRYTRLTLFSIDWAIALATEWVVIVLLVRAVVGLSHGMAAFLLEFRFWEPAFADSFLSRDFISAFILVALGWSLAGSFVGLVEEMGLRQMLIQMEAPSEGSERTSARDRLLSLILGVGTFLIIVTALLRVDLGAVVARSGDPVIQAPVFSRGGASTLLYFMLSLVLLSQTQFMELQTRWHLLRTPVSGELARRWALYALLFFSLMAALVSLLPTRYSLGFLNILGYGINILSGLLFMLGQLFFTVILYLLSLPFILLGRKAPFQMKPPQMPPSPQLPAGQSGSAGLPAWVEIARVLAIWALLITILIYSIVQYLRTHEEALRVLRNLPGGRLLVGFWDWLKGIFSATRLRTTRLVAAGMARLRPRPASLPAAGAFINLRRLNPRQCVTFFYLALLRRGDEHGLPRAASQTPREYAGKLDSVLPGVEQDIDSLTEAFVQARYSPHPVAPEQASNVKVYWERIKQALRGKLPEK
jgi:hypothetical protein